MQKSHFRIIVNCAFILCCLLYLGNYGSLISYAQAKAFNHNSFSAKSQQKHLDINPNIDIASQMTTQNTIYEVSDIINLKGQTISIPEGCTLSFNGGGFTGGTLKGNLTQIKGAAANIFSPSLYLTGTWDINRIEVKWFGALGDNTAGSNIYKDDAIAINHAIQQSQTISQWNQAIPVYLAPATYKISTPINIIYGTQLIGDSPRNSISMPSVRILRYGIPAGNQDDCAIKIADQTKLKNVAINIVSKKYSLNGINIVGTSDMELDNIAIANSHYGISKIFQKNGDGFTGTQLSNIKISGCVRGINISDNGKLKRSKEGLVSWMNHVYFNKIDISNCFECGMYFDVITYFDANTIDGLSITRVGNESFYPGNYFKDFSDKYIAAVYASVYNDNNVGLLSVQKGYIENVFCTNIEAGKPQNGRYFIDSFNYDRNPCFCVNNINLSVRDCHFQNDLVLVTSLGADNILMESCTDGEYYRGAKDIKRIYICCENPKTSLWLRSYNFSYNGVTKDCVKNSILTGNIRNLKLQNINCGNGRIKLDDVDYNKGEDGFFSMKSGIYLSDDGEGSGVWKIQPMSMNNIKDVCFKDNLVILVTEDLNLDRTMVISSDPYTPNSSLIFNLNGNTLTSTLNSEPCVFTLNNVSNCNIVNGTVKLSVNRKYTEATFINDNNASLGTTVELNRLTFVATSPTKLSHFTIIDSPSYPTSIKPCVSLYDVKAQAIPCTLAKNRDRVARQGFEKVQGVSY